MRFNDKILFHHDFWLKFQSSSPAHPCPGFNITPFLASTTSSLRGASTGPRPPGRPPERFSVLLRSKSSTGSERERRLRQNVIPTWKFGHDEGVRQGRGEDRGEEEREDKNGDLVHANQSTSDLLLTDGKQLIRPGWQSWQGMECWRIWFQSARTLIMRTLIVFKVLKHWLG